MAYATPFSHSQLLLAEALDGGMAIVLFCMYNLHIVARGRSVSELEYLGRCDPGYAALAAFLLGLGLAFCLCALPDFLPLSSTI